MTASDWTPARWTRYLIHDDRVFADGVRVQVDGHTIDIDVNVLPDHVAQLSRATTWADFESALVTFSQTYGLLASVARVLPAQGRRKRSVRDSVSTTWSYQHSRAIRTILELHQALTSRDTDGRLQQQHLDGVLDSLPVPRAGTVRAWRDALPEGAPDISQDLTTPAPREANRPRRVRVTREVGETSVTCARRLIAGLLTPNLAGVQRIYDATDGRPRFAFEQLIDVVYWTLADHLHTDRAMRACDECGTTFFVTDGRQRFCPPDPGKRESRCAFRFHKREQRRAAPPRQPRTPRRKQHGATRTA
jgi:hypothetical protein